MRRARFLKLLAGMVGGVLAGLRPRRAAVVPEEWAGAQVHGAWIGDRQETIPDDVIQVWDIRGGLVYESRVAGDCTKEEFVPFVKKPIYAARNYAWKHNTICTFRVLESPRRTLIVGILEDPYVKGFLRRGRYDRFLEE